MVLPVYLYGEPVLRTRAKEIDPQVVSQEKLQEVIASMQETMHVAEGIGLAAPQVGIPHRLFIIDATPLADKYPELKDFIQAFINPEITFYSEETTKVEEGCLSLPGIHEEVIRPKKIVIRYFDRQWQEHEEVFDDFRARIIQHEYDHIEGKLFVDYLSPLKKRLLRKTLLRLEKGISNASYPTKKRP